MTGLSLIQHRGPSVNAAASRCNSVSANSRLQKDKSIMLQKLHDYWNRLPHQVQAGITIFATMAATTLAKELQGYLSGNQAFTWLTLRHDIAAAVTAGLLALKAFYMIPAGTQPEQLVTPPKQSQLNPPLP
jgi:hypothetical protein